MVYKIFSIIFLMLAIFIDLMSKSQWADIITKLSTDYWKYKGFYNLPDGLKGNILCFGVLSIYLGLFSIL